MRKNVILPLNALCDALLFCGLGFLSLLKWTPGAAHLQACPLGLQESYYFCPFMFMGTIKWGLTIVIDQVNLGTSLDQKGCCLYMAHPHVKLHREPPFHIHLFY